MHTLQTPRLAGERALERENEAYEARMLAFMKVKQSYAQFGRGGQTRERLIEADLADSFWRTAKAEADLARGQDPENESGPCDGEER